MTLPCESEYDNQITYKEYSTVCQENGTWSTSMADNCIPITGIPHRLTVNFQLRCLLKYSIIFLGKCKKIPLQNTNNQSITICKRRGEDVNCEQEEFYPGTQITVRCSPGYRPSEIRWVHGLLVFLRGGGGKGS